MQNLQNPYSETLFSCDNEVASQRMGDLILNEENVTDDMAAAMGPLLRKPEFLYEFIRKCLTLTEKDNEAGPLEPKLLDLVCTYDKENPPPPPGQE